jgi:small subunit ribosomal protein S16
MMSMRLMRFGAKKKPFYRIVVMDSEKARQSQALDTVGTYNPMTEPAGIKVDQKKVKSWLDKGVRPSKTVESLLHRVTKTRKVKQETKP